MLSERFEMGQRQPADPARPFLAADPDERSRGISGEAHQQETPEAEIRPVMSELQDFWELQIVTL